MSLNAQEVIMTNFPPPLSYTCDCIGIVGGVGGACGADCFVHCNILIGTWEVDTHVTFF